MDSYKRWQELGKPTDYLIDCWLDSQSRDAILAEQNYWAAMWLGGLENDDPELAWKFLVLAAADDRFSNENLGLLAAGPLEGLLSKRGHHFIDRVEQEAATSKRFAWMLGGVWQAEMTEEIWQRVNLVWDRRGWDGIPADA
jgi:hypothetical protein